MAIEIINLLNGISIIGAARETRTLMGYPHLALNQACLPISAWPLNASD
tara:strand:+ start:465 stop:611 length:147 start_codon:yes stop_codon:yes gene_type:complete